MACSERYVCSIDIGGTKIAAAIVRAPGDGSAPAVVSCERVPTGASQGGEAVLDRVRSLAADLIARAPAPVAGVGVGSAGVIDASGSVLYANELMPGWGGIELGARLGESLGLPVSVMGDVHAHALGEARWGAGAAYRSVLCLGIGTGIGGAFVEGGRVLRGAHGAAGHLGHVESAAAAGLPCACGRSGHIESVASGTSVGRLFEERFGRTDPSRPVVGRDVNDLVAAGDERAIEVVGLAGRALGAALGSLANAFDPEAIVLSGGVIHGEDGWRSETWRTAVHEGFASQALDPLAGTPILIGTLEDDAPLIGSATNLLDELDRTMQAGPKSDRKEG